MNGSALDRPRLSDHDGELSHGGAWVLPGVHPHAAFAPEQLRALTDIAPPRGYRRGEPVYRPGDPADGFFVLLAGRVKIVLPGGERIAAILGPVDLFGGSACANASHHRTEAVSLDDHTRVTAVTAHHLEEVSRRLPTVALAYSRVLAERVQALEDQLQQARLPVQARLARTVIALAQRFGREVEPDIFELALDLRHDEIASLAGTSRARATAAMSAWRRMNLVRGTRGQYRLDLAGLRSFRELLELEDLG